MEEKSIDLKEIGKREIQKIHSEPIPYTKDLIANYPNKVVLLYSKGLENRQIGKAYFLLREAVKKNGIYITNDRSRLNSIKKYSQSLDFHKNGEFYFNEDTAMLLSDLEMGHLFVGKSIFLDLDLDMFASKIVGLDMFISSLRARNNSVSGICRIQVPDYSVI
ncbi:MAG: hypothetical protein ACTTKY_00140 [Catonella sp.]